MTLPTNRTTANTAAEHVADHNTLHGQHNAFEGTEPADFATVTGHASNAVPVSLAGSLADLVMGASTILARLAAGNIVAATPAQLKTLLAIATGDVSGLGSMATQAANNVAVTGGSVVGITDITVADGGTGASTAAAARTNLGVFGVSDFAIAPGSFIIPSGTLTTIALVNGTNLLIPMPKLRAGHVVAKIGAPLTIAGTVGSTSLRYGLWTVDLTTPTTFNRLHDCGVLADPTVADTEAASMLTLASPYTIPAGVTQVYASVVLQGAPAASPTIRGLSGVGSETVMVAYPAGTLRTGLTRTGITGALPATSTGVGQTTTAPLIIVKTG